MRKKLCVRIAMLAGSFKQTGVEGVGAVSFSLFLMILVERKNLQLLK
jgi:hypothetical protein